MLVRTFEAMNMQDAVKAIKRDLGQDAVILSTRERSVGDTANRMVEVTAAAPQGGMNDSEQSAGATMSGDVVDSIASFDRKLASLAGNLPTRKHMDTIESGLQELKLLLLENLRDKDGSAFQGLNAAQANLVRQLEVMGIDEAQTAKLAQFLRSLPVPDESQRGKPEEQEQFYRTQAMRWMLKRIRIAPAWTVTPGRTAFHAVVGPAGAGKTTSIAKLAAHFHLREKAKTLVVSWDNYRLAAADQLRTYCKIIGVPFVAVNTSSEIAAKVREHKDVDIVFIDTAGRNARNAKQVRELEALKTAGIPVEIHLALSITEKEQQLDHAVKTFGTVGLQSLMFTKLDAAWSFGDIYNLSLRWSLPLSWLSTGHEVPEDLERASRERLVDRIFGI